MLSERINYDMLCWQITDILITEREFGKRRTTAATPASARDTGTTATTILWMAVRPGSAGPCGAVFSCQALSSNSTQSTTAAHPATTSGIPSTWLPSKWLRAATGIPAPAASEGYGRVAWLWAGHGIPVFQRASAISTAATTAPGAFAAIEGGTYAPRTAPYEFGPVWTASTQEQPAGANRPAHCKPARTTSWRSITTHMESTDGATTR